MIHLDDNTALEIEKAADVSLTQFGDSWRSMTEAQLQDNQLEYLEQLAQFTGPSTKAIPVNVILEGEHGDEFMQICVRLSVVRLLLAEQPGFEYCGPKKSRT